MPFQGLVTILHNKPQAYSLGYYVTPFQGLVVNYTIAPGIQPGLIVLRPFRAGSSKFQKVCDSQQQREDKDCYEPVHNADECRGKFH
jgi:hypothetical protein